MRKEKVADSKISGYVWMGPNANEENLLFSLICIRFGTCEMRHLKQA